MIPVDLLQLLFRNTKASNIIQLIKIVKKYEEEIVVHFIVRQFYKSYI